MGLRAEFQQIPVDVFDALDDVVVAASLIQLNSLYAAGGSVSLTEIAYPTRLVEDTLTDAELTVGVARTGDRKFLVPALELVAKNIAKMLIDDPGVTLVDDTGVTLVDFSIASKASLFVVPQTKDVVRYGGIDWNVYQVEIDPAGALWTIYARQ